MSRPSRTGRATRRRSTRVTSRKKPTAARSSAACVWRAGCFAAPALQRFVREETLPGPQQVQTYDELLDYARRYGGTCYHASCTCLNLPDGMSVVDSELRVHRLDALRVIDASVMPAVTSTNTNAPTIMIAEKGAARQRLAAHPGPAEQEIDRTDALYTLHLYTFKSDRLTI